MTHNEPQFTLGVEEEFLLVDKETRALVIEPPKSLISECEELLGEQACVVAGACGLHLEAIVGAELPDELA